MRASNAKAFSSGVATGSREESASNRRRGAHALIDPPIQLLDIPVFDPERLQLRRQLREVFAIGAENILPGASPGHEVGADE